MHYDSNNFPKGSEKMTLKEILNTSGGILLVVSVLIQIAPIKINPWSALARYIGHALCGEILETIEEGKAETARYRIFRFDDEISHGVKHSEEHFNQMLEDIKTYEQYCSDHPNFKNGKAPFAISNIRKTYQKCRDNKSFI